MAQSSPQAAIIPTESSPFVAMLPFEMAIAMTGRLLALTTETQEAEVRSCKERLDVPWNRRFQVYPTDTTALTVQPEMRNKVD